MLEYEAFSIILGLLIGLLIGNLFNKPLYNGPNSDTIKSQIHRYLNDCYIFDTEPCICPLL